MIQLRSVLKIADNSGAKKLRVILVHGGAKKRFGRIADLVTASVIQAEPESAIRVGTKVKALIVRTRKEKRRADGSYIRFDDNAAVILESLKSKNPIGTRVSGPVARDIKEAGYNKIASLAQEVW